MRLVTKLTYQYFPSISKNKIKCKLASIVASGPLVVALQSLWIQNILMSALCREVKVDWKCRLTSAKLQYWLIFVNISVFVASMTDQLQSTHKLVSYHHQRCQMLMSQTVSLERVASSRWEFLNLKLSPWWSGGVFIRANWQFVWIPKSWNNILFGLWYWIDINTIYLKEEVKISSYVATRYMWFVLESNLSVIQFIHAFAPIGKMHQINGLISHYGICWQFSWK